MKIIFANNYYYLRGGSERVFFDEMEILEKDGHTIIPFTRKFDKNFSSNYEEYFPDDFKYHDVSLPEKIIAAKKLIYSSESKRSFSYLINKVKPDLVHVHNIYGRLTNSIIDSAKNHNIPVVMTLHDYKIVCPAYIMLRNGKICEDCKGGKFYKCFTTKCHKDSYIPSAINTFEAYYNNFRGKYKWISKFISPSQFLIDKHIESGHDIDNFIHIPNFIKLNDFKPNYNHKNYILFIGRLSKEKGINTLIKTFEKLDINLKIVGEGPEKDKIKNYLLSNKINNVMLEGYKTGNELKKAFQNAMFVIFPSEWYENAPMTILESFAYGKPVIGTKLGGSPEMIIPHETGLLYEAGNVDDLHNKILYLLDNEDLIKSMGKNARQLVEKEHSSESHLNQLLELYNTIIK